MIEVQIKSKPIYEELKQYASYKSDLTQVCSFRDELAGLLKEKGLSVNVDHSNLDKKPILDIKGVNVMKLENAPAEMLHFVGVRSEFDPTIPIRCMHEVALLIEQNLVQTTQKFDELYGKLGYRDKISSLVCSTVKFYGKGRLIDYIDKDLTIQSLKFALCKEKPIVYKQMSVKIVAPLIEKEKYFEIVGNEMHLDANGKSVNDSQQKVTLRFYGKSNKLFHSIAFKGNIVSIATGKISESNGSLMIYDPIILPNGLQYIKDVMYVPPSRAIPIDLYRNALYEFMYRYNVKN